MKINAATSPASLYTDSDQDATQSYWHWVDLHRLIDCQLGTASDGALPQLVDHVRLHRLVRIRMVTSVLEFRVGFSAVILADAQEKNEQDYG